MDEAQKRYASMVKMGGSIWEMNPNMKQPGPTFPKAKKVRVCFLPGCEVKHTHNGGYCCADHCKEHRAIRKSK